MAEQRLIDTQWVEIVPPVPPEPIAWWVWMLIVVLSLMTGVLAWRWWQAQPRQYALRQLRLCERALGDAGQPPKQIAARIFYALQHVLHAVPTQRIRHADPRWQTYQRRLAGSVFDSQPPSAEELRALVRETRAWLRQDGGR